jgi:hypothetical protein
MQITLRKANAIQAEINELLKELELSSFVKINEFQEPDTVVETAHKLFFENVSRRVNLVTALYEIRKAVSRTNSEAGIDTLLADVAFLDKQLAFYSNLSKKTPRLEKKVLNGKILKLKESDSASYYRADEVETSILTEEDITKFVDLAAVTKKSKQKLQDQLLELNVYTTIELADPVVTTLQAENIL